jgi:hypothetical protein
LQKNEITGTQTSFSINFGGELNFIPSFILPERLCFAAVTYIFIASTLYTIIIFTLKPCALNSEFRHFILECHFIQGSKEQGPMKLGILIGQEL